MALDRLKEEGYLNDRRFASAWARGRLRTKPMGPYRLSRELEVKGVEAQLVREILEDVYEEGEEPVAAGRWQANSQRSVAGRFHREPPRWRGFSTEEDFQAK